MFQPRVAQVSLFEIIFEEDLSHMKKPDSLRFRSTLPKEAGRPPSRGELATFSQQPHSHCVCSTASTVSKT